MRPPSCDIFLCFLSDIKLSRKDSKVIVSVSRIEEAGDARYPIPLRFAVLFHKNAVPHKIQNMTMRLDK
jgi:hypothetical protein